MEALIVVDVQNDFLPGGTLEVPLGDAIIPVINSLQKRIGLTVATQDWHPRNHQSFAASHKNKKPYQVIRLKGLEQTLWPEHCIQGTAGAEFASTLHQLKIEAIFRKGMDPVIDSYSGFFDNGKLKQTGMHAYLRSKNVRKLYIAGLAADYCVYFTAMDGIELGYEVTIIEDATKAIDNKTYQTKLNRFKKCGGSTLISNIIS